MICVISLSDMRHNKVTRWQIVSHFEFNRVEIGKGIYLPEIAHFVL